MSDPAWPLIAHIADGRPIKEAEAVAIIEALRSSHATDTAGLQRRLHAAAAACVTKDDAIMREAAAALSALRAENERLTRARIADAAYINEQMSRAEAAEAERDRLRAELARLRGLLGQARIALPRGSGYRGLKQAIDAALTQTDRTGEMTDE